MTVGDGMMTEAVPFKQNLNFQRPLAHNRLTRLQSQPGPVSPLPRAAAADALLHPPRSAARSCS